MVIDSHHHFWNYNPVDFDWIDDEKSSIRKSFLPADLEKAIKQAGIDGVVSVQARQMIEETEWLLKLAAENDFIKGVVGWVPLASASVKDYLDKYTVSPKLKSVRHLIQGEPDPEFILGKNFNKGVSIIKDYKLVYDILVFDYQLPNTIKFTRLHPNQQFVIDHIAKPKIKTNEIKDWAINMKELAKNENIACKISGMVTEANYKTWTEEQLKPYFDAVLETFGPRRLMFGSDWPVCLVATSYKNWLEVVMRYLSGLSRDEQDMIFYKNATRIYNLQID